MYMFFFFKQKTAYEMRISDWSSDVCSSDLLLYEDTQLKAAAAARDEAQKRYWHAQTRRNAAMARAAELLRAERAAVTYDGHRFERLGLYIVRVSAADTEPRIEPRSEERRVGTVGVSTCRSMWAQYY